MTVHEHSPETPAVKVHIASSDVKLGGSRHRGRAHTKYSTIKIPQANASGAVPVLPADEHRICAVIIAHNPASTADAASSSGWIGTSQAGVKAGDPNSSMYVHAAGQAGVLIYGSEVVFGASDASSTTDLWLSIADSTEAEPA